MSSIIHCSLDDFAITTQKEDRIKSTKIVVPTYHTPSKVPTEIRIEEQLKTIASLGILTDFEQRSRAPPEVATTCQTKLNSWTSFTQ
jgi:hypothetical protein